MTSFRHRVLLVAACALALAPAAWAAPARRQEPAAVPPPGAPMRPGGPRRGLPPGAAVDGLTAGQVEQLFDRYVLGQARVALQLSPSQFVPFGRRLQALQMTRRQGQRQRVQLLNELNAITRGGATPDEADVAAKLKALDDLNADVDRRVRDAYTAVEDTLTVGQRARFRLFEQRMERQKLDLIARARQAARQGGAPTAEPAP